MQRLLSQGEASGVLSRHFDLALKVAEHEQLVRAGLWNPNLNDLSVTMAGLYPIPPSGLTIRDDVYGNVVVYPDTNGWVYYSADVPDVVAAQTSKPVYHSTPAPGPNPYTTLIVIAAVLIVVHVAATKYV